MLSYLLLAYDSIICFVILWRKFDCFFFLFYFYLFLFVLLLIINVILSPFHFIFYVAPEKIPAIMEDGTLIPNPYGKAADMFSIGVITYFLYVFLSCAYTSANTRQMTLLLTCTLAHTDAESI